MLSVAVTYHGEVPQSKTEEDKGTGRECEYSRLRLPYCSPTGEGGETRVPRIRVWQHVVYAVIGELVETQSQATLGTQVI